MTLNNENEKPTIWNTSAVSMQHRAEEPELCTRPRLNSTKPFSDRTEQDLSSVLSSDRTELIEIWKALIGTSPPKHVSKQFMQKAIAFEQQVQKLGGHSKQVQRAFKTLLNTKRIEKSKSLLPTSKLNLKAGTYLVREWNGRTYQVKVLEDGFELENNRYSSLTKIAEHITGAHWSGPRFFGLNR